MLNKKHITTIAALSLSAVLLTGCQAITEPVNIMSPNAVPEAPAVQPTETTLGSSETTGSLSESAVSSAQSSTQTAKETDFEEKETSTPRVTINLNCSLPTDVPETVAIMNTKPFWFKPGLPEELLLKDVDYKWAETRRNTYYPEIEEPIYYYAEEETLLLGYNGNQGGDFFFRRYDEHMYGTTGNFCALFRAVEQSYTDETLEDFTPEEATNMALELLGKLGITNLGKPDVVAVRAEKANEWLHQTYWENKDGTPAEWKDWTKDDEVYYLSFPIMVNDIPIAFSGSHSGGCTRNDFKFDGTYVYVTVGRDEVISIQVHDMPDPEMETVSDAQIKVSAQEALDILTDHHTAEDFPTAIDINDVSLVYVISKGEKYWDTCEATLIPMWQFEMTYESELGDNVVMTELIDAQRGIGQFEH